MEASKKIYSLYGEFADSNHYYEEVGHLAKAVEQDLLIGMKDEIQAFQDFIREQQLEKVRTKLEYGLELLILGVFWQTYENQANHLNWISGKLLQKVASTRKKVKYMKPLLGKMKGQLTSRYLFPRSDKVQTSCTLEQLVFWMASTGEYDEEAIRLKQWQLFCGKQSEVFNQCFKEKVWELASRFKKQVEGTLKKYVAKVEAFRTEQALHYAKREDRIFCMQPKEMYYLNMIGAQILNEIYQKDFAKTTQKMIFLPGCMVQQGKKGCQAVSSHGSFKCMGCTPHCQVNQISKLSSRYGAKTRILYHESQLNHQKIDEKKQIGVIGVACVLSLLSGGFKAKRLGYIPQCVLLDYCGCSGHWYKEGLITKLSLPILEKKLRA
ncbi:MAG: DUF116 domain-containing protein [Cellulosilyticum sp.]|nr:DUF116 domain-containing protein [Cellulosilyticum sp.]